PIGNTGVSVSHGQTAGYLGTAHEPFALRGDTDDPSFQIRDVRSPFGVDPARLPSRRALVDAVDQAQRTFDASASSRPPDRAYEQALGQLFSAKAKRAFDLAAEN